MMSFPPHYLGRYLNIIFACPFSNKNSRVSISDSQNMLVKLKTLVKTECITNRAGSKITCDKIVSDEHIVCNLIASQKYVL